MDKKNMEVLKDVSVIIPVYNEEESIGKVIDTLKSLYPGLAIIVIDDCSTDKTYEQITKRDVKAIQHHRNKGYGASLKTGLKNCQTKYALFFDADGQHDPKDVIRLADEISGGYDMVIGARTKDSQVQLARKPGKWVLHQVANMMVEQKIPDLNSGLRIVKAELARNFMHLLPNKFSFSTTITIIFMKELLEVKFIPIKTVHRVGKSTVKYFRDGFNTILLIAKIIMLFDPLRIFIPASIIIFAIGLIRFAQMLIQHDLNIVTSLFGMFTVVLIFFFGLLADQLAMIRRELK